MKKLLSCILCLIFAFSLYSCDNSAKKADEYANGFISALLLKDEEGMKKYIHPDHTETAMPDEEFYKNISEHYFFTVVNSLDAIYAIGKSNSPLGINEGEGEQNIYKYTVLSNELYYDIDLRILENDKGYGIVGVSFALNTNPELYTNASEAK